MGKSLFIYSLLPFISLFGLVLQESVDLTGNSEVKDQIHSGLVTEDPKCLDCHSDLIESAFQHKPASASCSECHQVNITDHTVNGARGLMLNAEVPQLCYSCHGDLKQIIDTSKNVHQAVLAEGQCTICHSPHSSDEKKLLVTGQKKLCLSCHNKDISEDGKKVVNIKKLISVSKVIHPPVENSGCVVCHQPHASSNNYLLISAFPKGNYAKATLDNFAFCWECHDSDLLEVSNTTSATNFRDGDRNLHFVHMNAEKGRSCVMCHNVHATMNEHLIETKVKFGEWELPVKFTPSEKGGSCFPGCHAEKSYNNVD